MKYANFENTRISRSDIFRCIHVELSKGQFGILSKTPIVVVVYRFHFHLLALTPQAAREPTRQPQLSLSNSAVSTFTFVNHSEKLKIISQTLRRDDSFEISTPESVGWPVANFENK